jgi:hypothetical protein
LQPPRVPSMPAHPLARMALVMSPFIDNSFFGSTKVASDQEQPLHLVSKIAKKLQAAG